MRRISLLHLRFVLGVPCFVFQDYCAKFLDVVVANWANVLLTRNIAQ